MAKQIRKPPSPSDYADPRAREYFDADVHDQLRMANTATVDLPNLTAGATTTFTIPVKGALADEAQTVVYGLPSGWNSGLQVTAWVSANDVVTIAVHNTTGGAINMGSGLYSVRVQP